MPDDHGTRVAVGSYVDSKGKRAGPPARPARARTWTAAKAPLLACAASNPSVSLDSVSCPTASQCTVGGGYENTAAQPVGLLLLWSGKTWKAAPTPSGAYMVRGISCPTIDPVRGRQPRCRRPSSRVDGALTGHIIGLALS